MVAEIENIAENAPVSIIAFDVDGTIAFLNSAAKELLGVLQANIAGKPLIRGYRYQTLLHELWIRLRKKRCADGGKIDEFEMVVHPDGECPEYLFIRYRDLCGEDGRLAGWVAAIHDITEQKKADLKLRESEAFYRTLFEHGGFGIGLVDPESGKRVAFNRTLHERLGYTREEYQHLTVADIQFDDIPENTLNRGRQAIKKGAYTFEERQRAKDGRLCHVLVSAVPVTIGGKELIHAISLDITEKKQLEMELRQAQKLEALGRLAGGVAHDFNNMLNVIIGYADLVCCQLQPGSPFYGQIGEIRKAAIRSADLTKQLLAFSRKQVIAPQVVRLNRVISDQLEMLRRLIGEEIHIAFRPCKDLWPMEIDSSQIHQILTNLVANARDAIDGVGSIFIETANRTVSDADVHMDVSPGDYILLAVRDTGMGMDPLTQEYIFEPFFTTKTDGKGTGLGLATVYGIVKQNHGGIHVYSDSGIGTTINIYLPRFTGDIGDEPDREAGRVDDMAGQLNTGHGETILVVEDEAQLLELATEILEKHGYHVIGVATPSGAMDVCRQPGQRIDLLLTDVVMPEMNGMELQARMRAVRPGLKTLFMSGHSADIVSRRGIIEQEGDFLNKPFSVKDLMLKVRQALDR